MLKYRQKWSRWSRVFALEVTVGLECNVRINNPYHVSLAKIFLGAIEPNRIRVVESNREVNWSQRSCNGAGDEAGVKCVRGWAARSVEGGLDDGIVLLIKKHFSLKV